jgi:hypothetical protein
MFRWRETEGEHAARPYVRSVTGNSKEKEKKTHSKNVSVRIDGANKKFPEARRRLFFLFTDWSKSVLSASAKQRGDCGLFDPGTGGLFALYRRRFAVYISLYL